MQKVLKHGAALLRRMIWLGMVLQVLLGLFWMLNNMGVEHNYGVDWSSGGPLNRPFMQWGALYAFIVKLVMGMAQWLHIPYYSLIYCLQLAVAFVSVWFLLGQVTGWRRYLRLGGAAVMVTVPMAMQSHLALLPYSLTGSVVLLELAFVMALHKQEKWSVRTVLPVFSCWVLAAFLMPEYLWLGAIPVVLAVIGYLWQNRKQWRAHATVGAMILACIVCIVGVGSAWQQKATERLSPQQLVVARCSWSNLYALYGMWSPEVQEIIEIDTLRRTCDNPEVFFEGFFDGFGRLSKEQEDAYLRQMLDSAWDAGGMRLLLEIAYDGVGYLLPGAVVSKHLAGEGFISLTGMNYWHFIRSSTDWSIIYMRWYCSWFWLAAVAALVVRVPEVLSAGGGKHLLTVGKGLKPLGAGLLMAVGAACFYAMSRIGVYDYKILFWWTCIWCMGTLMLIEEPKKERGTK